MPTQQEIVMNIQAQLDEGNVQSEAAQMASQVARSIEQAFEGLGQRIADAIMKGGAAGVSGLVDQYNRPMQGTAAPLAPPVPQMGTSNVGFGSQPVLPSSAGSPMDQFQGGFPKFLDPYVSPNLLAQMPQGAITQQLIEQSQRSIFPMGRTPAEGLGQGAFADSMTAQARMIQNARRAGMDVGVTEEQQEAFGKARDIGVDTFRQLQEEVSTLSKQLERASKNLVGLQEELHTNTGASQEQKMAIHDSIESEKANVIGLQQNIGRISAQSAGVASGVQATGALAGIEGGLDFGRVAGVAGVLGTMLGNASQSPGLIRQSGVAGAETENLLARTALRGDFDRALAIERAGGAGALSRQGGLEAALGIGGNVLGAVGSTLLSPATGGLSLMGTAQFGGKAIEGAFGFNQSRQQSINSQIEAEMGRNAEFFEFARAGRGTAIEGFRSAQGMGAPGLSGFMAGGMDERMAQMRLNQAMGDTSRTEFIQGQGMVTRGLNRDEETARQENIRRMSRDVENARQFTVNGMSLRQYAVEQGLDEGQFRGTMGGLARNMGGEFLGEAGPRLETMVPQVAQILRMQGMGLSNAGDVAGGLFAGGANRADAMNQTRDMFEDAVSAGLDKARVGQALQTVAQQAASAGLGGAAAAQEQFQRAMGAAQQVFGGQVEGPQMQLSQQMMQMLGQAGAAEGGVEAVGGLRGVRQFENRFGLKLNPIQERELQRSQQVSPEGMRLFLQRTQPNREFSQEQLEEMSGVLPGMKAEGIRATDVSVGGTEAANLAMMERSGQTSLEARERALQLSRLSGAGTAPITGGGLTTTQQRTLQRLGIEAPSRRSEEQVPTGMDPELARILGGSATAPRAEVEARNVAGRDQAQALAQVDATKIAAGLSTLGNQLPAVNRALSELVDRANAVLLGGAKGAGADKFGSMLQSVGGVKGMPHGSN